jgi:hypothetical protein
VGTIRFANHRDRNDSMTEWDTFTINDRTVLIDAVDAHLLILRHWYTIRHRHTGYVVSHSKKNGRETLIRLHRVILDNPNGVVDHINGNGLDNRRSNLRVCTIAENCRNSAKYRSGKTSTYKGVSKFGNKWRGTICLNNKQIYLGSFDDEMTAARAYDAAAVIHHGEFARLNFPNSEG